MARLVRLVFVVAVTAATVLLIPNAPAHACSCVRASESQHRARADAVFSGVVTAKNSGAGVQSLSDPVVYTVDVDGVDKGRVSNPATVRSDGEANSCAPHFAVGGRYRIFALENRDGTLRAGSCMRYTALGAAEDDEAGGSKVPLIPAAALGVLGVGVAAFLIRRFR